MQLQDADWQTVRGLVESGVAGFVLRYLSKMSRALDKISKQVAVLTERSKNDDRRITRVERLLPFRRP